LNAECLELEDLCTSLKKEVQEAWDNYKSSQEKAAIREDELQDEIKQIQKAKYLDRQQMISQITKLTADLEESIEKSRLHQKERDEAYLSIGEFQQVGEYSLRIRVLMILLQVEETWKAAVAQLEQELSEARSGTVQGVHSIREELNNALHTIETMRSDHASILRLSQSKQAELEQSNAQLSLSLAEKQREVSKLKALLSDESSQSRVNGLHADSMREYERLQLQVSQLTDNIESEGEKTALAEKRIKQLELENKAAMIAYDEDRKRYEKAMNDLSSQNSLLSDKLRDLEASKLAKQNLASSSIFDKYEDDELGHLKTQVQDVSKQLLRKQGQVVELQAERSALKSRIQDLQTRCLNAERQLAATRDIEDDDYADEGEDVSYKSSSFGTLRRRTADNISSSDPSSSSPRGKNNIVNGLEKIGLKTAPGVAKAVDLLDSWTMLIIRLVRSHPLVRLGIAIYLVALHVWVIIILAIHTHSLELETDPREAIIISKS
jgi:hypothetical protein